MKSLPLAPPTSLLTPSPAALLALRATHATLHGKLDVESAVKLALREGTRDGLLSDADARAAVASSIFGTTVLRARLAQLLAAARVQRHSAGTSSEDRRYLATAHLLALFLLHERPHRCSNEAMRATLPAEHIGLHSASLSALAALDPASDIYWPSAAVPRIAAKYSLPCGLVRQWVSMLGRGSADSEDGLSEVEALGRALAQPAPVTLRTNRAIAHPSTLTARLRAEGISCRTGTLSPWAILLDGAQDGARQGRAAWGGSVWNLDAWQQGCFEVQDEGSQCISLACEAVAGDKVLDLCAGNGGKTLALAALVGPTGHVLAHDVVPSRLAALRASAQRAHVATWVHTVATDGRAHSRDDAVLDARDDAVIDARDDAVLDARDDAVLDARDDAVLDARDDAVLDEVLVEASRANAPHGHDVVLVDAPCSSSGALRRHPGLRWSGLWSGVAQGRERQALPILQRRLLRQGVALTRRGGALVYATCALDARENEEVATAFEAECAGRIVPWPFAVGQTPGRHEEPGRTHFRTLWPHRHGPHASPDGFFIARWRVV